MAEANPEDIQQAAAAEDEAASKRAAMTAKRRTWLTRLAIAVGVIALVYALWYFLIGRNYVSTDNAFIKADKVIISPEVAGPISELLVKENQPVHKGDVLFRIGSGTFAAAVEKAQANVDKSRSDILALQAAYKAKQAELTLSRNNLAFAEKEYARVTELASKNFASQIQLDERKHQLDVTRQQEQMLEQDLARVLANLNGDAKAPVEKHPAFLAAQAELTQAKINLDRTELHAPFDGIASNVPQLGQHLNPGSPAMSVVANTDLWIEANFNETDLTRVAPGQKVDIRIDTYPDKHWHGTVASVSPAKGAEFSILPPQNATGNWVKVIQRIPVRIQIDRAEGDPVLRAGMSARVKIDTKSLVQ